MVFHASVLLMKEKGVRAFLCGRVSPALKDVCVSQPPLGILRMPQAGLSQRTLTKLDREKHCHLWLVALVPGTTEE